MVIISLCVYTVVVHLVDVVWNGTAGCQRLLQVDAMNEHTAAIMSPVMLLCSMLPPRRVIVSINQSMILID